MDLSFPPFDRAAELVAWPGDLAALMVGVAARQGASPTALVQGALPAIDLPAIAAQASFNPEVAALLIAWAARMEEGRAGTTVDVTVNGPFTAAGQGIFNACCQEERDAFKPGKKAPIEDL